MPLEQSELKIKTVKTERLAPDPKGTAQALQRIGYSQFRGFSKMTLSWLQAQAPRMILSGFSPSNCTEKTKRKPVCQVCQLRAS
jgi:hypothetical protein